MVPAPERASEACRGDLKFKPGDDVIIVRRTPQGVPPGVPARVLRGLRVWDDRDRRIIHEYSIEFEGGNGSYSVEEECLDYNGPLDQLAREA